MSLVSRFGLLMRGLFGALFSISIASCATVGDPVEIGRQARPNIVLVLVDDLGIMDVAPYGDGAFYETPNIERFSEYALVFTDGYAASPVCSPSRYSLLTGKYPTRGKATDWFRRPGVPGRSETYGSAFNVNDMAPKERTIAESLRDFGYTTTFIGKWHLGHAESLWPEAQGFETNIGGFDSGSPRGSPGYFAPYNNPRLDDGPDGEYLTRRLAREAAADIASHAGSGQPFFLMLSFYNVHNPLGAPAETVAHFENKRSQLGLTDEYSEDVQIRPNVKRPRRVRTSRSNPTYAAMVYEMDAAFGKVLDALEENGLAENTIVVFTSDNGGLSTSEGLPTSNVPFRGGKGWTYEGGIRVPFIVSVPQGRSGRNSHAVSAIDLYPTLLDFAGAVAHEPLDGVSLRPLLMNTSSLDNLSDRSLVWHYPHYSNQGGIPSSAIRRGSYKLIRNLENGFVELYDLSSDPSERTDIAAKYPSIVNSLLSELDEFYVETDAEFLTPGSDGVQPWVPPSASR